ncbi:hypothetical protein JKP88DRAFT_352526, partial [Tribonema minus]
APEVSPPQEQQSQEQQNCDAHQAPSSDQLQLEDPDADLLGEHVHAAPSAVAVGELGAFARRALPPLFCIPYVGLVIPARRGDQRVYAVNALVIDEITATLRAARAADASAFAVDASPAAVLAAGARTEWTLGARVNEAPPGTPPNCVFITNVAGTDAQYRAAAAAGGSGGVPVAAALYVTTRAVAAGEELLGFYGNAAGYARPYALYADALSSEEGDAHAREQQRSADAAYAHITDARVFSQIGFLRRIAVPTAAAAREAADGTSAAAAP